MPSRLQAEDGVRHQCVAGFQTCALSFSSRRRHTRSLCDWSSDVCSSDLVQRVLALLDLDLHPRGHARPETRLGLVNLHRDPEELHPPTLLLLLGQGAHEGDRKSTRLNSSHTVISYAVFCLKKKKQMWYVVMVSYQQMLESIFARLRAGARRRSRTVLGRAS